MDIIQSLLDILRETGASYCVVGGLAVNAYVEPVVSLEMNQDARAKDRKTWPISRGWWRQSPS